MKFILILKYIIFKILKLNLSFLKREISGYPESVKKFERDFAKFIGKEYGITFCNGTSTIEAAIYALNFSPGDEILVTSSIFHASLGPIKNLNCEPIFVDIDKETLTIDCIDLKNKINDKSKGLLIVHPWGYPCNMDEITKIVKENNLKLIEDCSHAHGAVYDNKKIGSFADISCFSLQGAKSIAAGEGGIAVTNNKDHFLRMSVYGHFNRHQSELTKNNDLKKFSKTGISKKLRAHPLGINLASVDLKNLSTLNNYKTEIYNKIDKIFMKYKSINIMKLNDKAERGGFFGGYPFFFNDLTNIDQIKKNFKKFKIDIDPYPWLAHHQMNIFNKKQTKLIVTEKIINHFFMIRIPYFLNFNFKNLENCLIDCKKNNLIE